MDEERIGRVLSSLPTLPRGEEEREWMVVAVGTQ